MATPKRDRPLEFPATGRNRVPILKVLERVLPETGTVLEIASGSGQHAAYFAPRLAGRTWQASDPDPGHRSSALAWAALEAPDLPPPLDLDALDDGWTVDGVTAVVAVNLVHVAPWEVCLGLLDNAARLLPLDGVLYLYGPFKVGGRHTAPSNAAFDEDLRRQHPAWGIRNLDDVALEARARGFQLAETVAMPANNFSVVFRRMG